MTIERAIGQLKRRFPKLSKGLAFRSIVDSANCVVACVILHNICKEFDDEDTFEQIDENIDHGSAHNLMESEAGSAKRDEIARLFV